MPYFIIKIGIQNLECYYYYYYLITYLLNSYFN